MKRLISLILLLLLAQISSIPKISLAQSNYYFYMSGAVTGNGCFGYTTSGVTHRGTDVTFPVSFNVPSNTQYSSVTTISANGVSYPAGSGSGTFQSFFGATTATNQSISLIAELINPPFTAGVPRTTTHTFTLSGGISTKIVVTVFCSAGSGSVPQVSVDFYLSNALFTDGRCNMEPDQSVTIYSDGNGGYNFYAIYQSVGYFALHLTQADLDAKPDTGKNYLIAETKGVQVYRLKGGALEVRRLKADGKVYEFIWPPCH